jgi:hypothetical protein
MQAHGDFEIIRFREGSFHEPVQVAALVGGQFDHGSPTDIARSARSNTR